VIYFQYKHYSV